MPTEIEAKMKVEDFDAVRRRLREAGATPGGKVLETNTFCDTAGGSLVAAGKGLRVRRNHDQGSGRDEYVITFKGPLQRGELKTREEIEAEVANGDEAARLLEALGFKPVLSFEKRRESW